MPVAPDPDAAPARPIVVRPITDDPTVDPPPPTSACIAETETGGHYGTLNIDELRDVVVTRDGTIVVAGFENGTPSMMPPTRSRRAASP